MYIILQNKWAVSVFFLLFLSSQIIWHSVKASVESNPSDQLTAALSPGGVVNTQENTLNRNLF